MIDLQIKLASGTLQIASVGRRLSTLGRASDNDIVLDDPAVSETHAQLLVEDDALTIIVIDDAPAVMVNGKSKRKHRFVPNEPVHIGSCQLQLQTRAAPTTTDVAERDALAAYESLYRFSARLLNDYDPQSLLANLLDAVIELTHADKGFLLLFEDKQPRIKVARNLRRENIADAVEQLSDSIVDKVIKTKQPLIVSDALKDAEFQNAMSVVSLKLSSVMCVPLIDRGQLLGALYVGNDRIAELFTERHLRTLIVFSAQAALLIVNALLVNDLKLDNRQLNERIEAMRFGDIIGACPAMQDIYRRVDKVASTDVSVLITGETGTGKELIAREIHRRSPRQKGPFITINCGAIPENLLESELFGHVRGAFTGAVANRPGKFQSADGGTLFLDEIGELPTHLQVKLLRALQERVVTRVGDTRAESIDIRVLCATNRNLEDEIAKQHFREDLYYRLNVVNLHLPPLRERGEDLVVIAKYLLARYAKEFNSQARSFSAVALSAIRRFAWPGNIRQLENHIKKACVLTDHHVLEADELGLTGEALPAILPLAEAKERFQRDYIDQILALNNGNRTKAARDLGVDPRTIFRHLEKDEPGKDKDAP